MISNEKYVKLLKQMISCVSHGDYEAVKELANFELKKIQNTQKNVDNSNNL